MYYVYFVVNQIVLAPSTFNMKVIIILLSVSLIVAVFFLVAYLWSVKNGQFDDDYSPAHRILFDDLKKPDTESDISK